MSEERRKLVAVSLFTGAGGLDLGVEQNGVHIAVALERDPVACRTLKRNFVEGRKPPSRQPDTPGGDRTIAQAARRKTGALRAAVLPELSLPGSELVASAPGRR